MSVGRTTQVCRWALCLGPGQLCLQQLKDRHQSRSPIRVWGGFERYEVPRWSLCPHWFERLMSPSERVCGGGNPLCERTVRTEGIRGQLQQWVRCIQCLSWFSSLPLRGRILCNLLFLVSRDPSRSRTTQAPNGLQWQPAFGALRRRIPHGFRLPVSHLATLSCEPSSMQQWSVSTFDGALSGRESMHGHLPPNGGPERCALLHGPLCPLFLELHRRRIRGLPEHDSPQVPQ